ncbi:MAG TPA: hypothetical protein VLB00_04405 [Gemmatimonadales bacterium]|nr:hypothetical protein [Gemmatimonadales bacterium]
MLRWLAAAALVIGALYVTLFRAAPPVPESAAAPEFSRMADLMSRQRRAMILWSALAARDSALARLAASAPPPGEPRIVATGFGGEAVSKEAEALVRQRWSAIGTADSSVRTLVLLYNGAEFDTLRSQMYPYSGALLPADDSGTCVAMTSGILKDGREIDILKSQLDLALAPCLLRAAFGVPGRPMREWLERTGHAAARSNAWLGRPRSVLDGNGRLPWEPMYDDSWRSLYAASSSSLIERLSTIELTMMLAPPYVMGGPALRCLAGNAAECSRTVLDSIPLRREALPDDLTAFRFWEFGRRNRPGALVSVHPIGDWFLSDIIRQEGRERFARFWRSDQPLDAAFHEAFGRDLGEWTRDWGIRQRLGSWEERYSRKFVVLGANLAPSWPLLALGWTAAALLLAAWTARRRQVT